MYVKSKKAKFTETKSRMMVVRGKGHGGKWGDGGQRVQTSKS